MAVREMSQTAALEVANGMMMVWLPVAAIETADWNGLKGAIAAALLAAAAEEREAIAKFVEEDDCGANEYHKPSDPRHVAGIAAAIRGRSSSPRSEAAQAKEKE